MYFHAKNIGILCFSLAKSDIMYKDYMVIESLPTAGPPSSRCRAPMTLDDQEQGVIGLKQSSACAQPVTERVEHARQLNSTLSGGHAPILESHYQKGLEVEDKRPAENKLSP